ncbi:hypothetical protein GRI44_04505 [Altererythrobacter confluentis]|uniref:DUF6680 domain-containing protein n=1 Tax=Allopontixanthobacter confluentis TaxID=1849021 RepID=A0A6L7GGE4_9SPHN|nr:DUF6680 family protein [Allopontixanthobacter confluentis]MXP14008.1 hypothetical protein [Allopontixanthobacter confluentis]
MSTTELLTLAAILIGPVLAIVVQIVAERRKQIRESRVQTFRTLVSTRHLPGDPSYSTAINMIPIDFNRVRPIEKAHEEYIRTILYKASKENAEAHNRDIIDKQTKLIFEIARKLGYSLKESDIQNAAYAAGGFIERDNLMLSGWQAWTRIASALEKQNSHFIVQENEGN